MKRFVAILAVLLGFAALASAQKVQEVSMSTAQEWLKAQPQKITLNELTDYTRVRSIQIRGSQIYTYQYFPCRIYWEVSQLCFNKHKGSQRHSGLLDQDGDTRIKYVGWWFHAGEQEVNDDQHHEEGYIKKISDSRVILVLEGKDKTEILELCK